MYSLSSPNSDQNNNKAPVLPVETHKLKEKSDNTLPHKDVTTSPGTFRRVPSLKPEKGSDQYWTLMSRLCTSAYNGSLSEVKSALESGADPAEWCSLALAEASGGGSDDVVKTLLDAKANPCSPDHKALPNAARKGHTNIVRMLLKAKANPRGIWEDPLVLAAKNGHSDTVLALLDAGVPPFIGLSSAAGSGHIEITKILLYRMSKTSKSSCSFALYDAGFNRHEDVVKLLINDPRVITSIGAEFPLKVPEGDLCTEIVQMFLDPSHKNIQVQVNRMNDAVENGRTEIVQMFVDFNYKWYHQNVTSCQAFCKAAANGHNKVVELLLGIGADPNGNEYDHPLTGAAMNGHEATVKMLLAAGANPTADDSKALYLAARKGHEQVVRLLLDARPDVKGASLALPAAVYFDYKNIVKILLSNGADPNVRNNQSLRTAVEKGDEEMALQLLAAGADPSGNYFGLLSTALQKGHTSLFVLLLSWCSDLQKATTKALHDAVKYRRTEIAELLLDLGAVPAGTYGGPLVPAVANQDVGMVKRLLKANADPTSYFHRPLMKAAELENEEIFDLLLARCPDKNKAYSDVLVFSAAKDKAMAFRHFLNSNAKISEATRKKLRFYLSPDIQDLILKALRRTE